MKTKLFIVIVLLIMSFIPISTVMADNPKTYFTGITCSRYAGEGGIYVEHGMIGRMTGLHDQYDYIVSDSRLNGLGDVTINFTWREGPDGPLWGTVEIVNDGGTWVGQWNGMSEDGSYNIHGILNGTGAYEHLVAYYNQSRPYEQQCMDIEGYIVETGN